MIYVIMLIGGAIIYVLGAFSILCACAEDDEFWEEFKRRRISMKRFMEDK